MRLMTLFLLFVALFFVGVLFRDPFMMGAALSPSLISAGMLLNGHR